MSELHRIPVIIDTDPGVDDTLALLFALASPELEILAITITFGNTDVDACWNNVLKVFDILARHLEKHPEDHKRFPNFQSSDIFLAKGSQGPLEGDMHKAEYFHGRDGLSDITNRHPELALRTRPNGTRFYNLVLQEESAESVSIDLIEGHPAGTITYIALGPLTTMAKMLRQNRKTVCEKLGRIVCMGGALDVPGNTSPVAEFNFFADPYAVQEVLGLGSGSEYAFPLDRFVLLPLDITTSHELPMPLYASTIDPDFDDTFNPSQESSKAPLHHFTSSFLERTREIMKGFGKDAVELHDVVAVWCACMNPPSMSQTNYQPQMQEGWSWSPRIFDIERKGELTRGMLVVDRREDKSLYELGANRAEVQALLETGNVIPAPVQTDKVGGGYSGLVARQVACVVKTPGPEALLKEMFKRIWDPVAVSTGMRLNIAENSVLALANL